jgi:catechol 2,3-dioxygenase-like lactoylglutathione lyase family enzyme
VLAYNQKEIEQEREGTMIRGIHHTAISTGDLDRALKFYRDLLGFEVAIEFEWPKGTEFADSITGLKDSAARTAMLKAGNMMIEIFEYSSPAPQEGDPARPVCDHGITHICVDVVDIEAEYERLKAAGMTFHCPPQDLGISKATYGRDPDGNVVELQEVLDKSSPVALPL